jgi:pimeloyl-ACP methyl ester carboxylesterase
LEFNLTLLKTLRIATEKGKFHAHLMGDHGEWVVCWPGQLQDHESFKEFAQTLALDFRVLLCDIPAFGANRALPYTHSIDHHVYFARQLLAALKIDRCHWVGLSGGGVIGAALHNVMPQTLISLTLASTPLLSQSRISIQAMAASTFLGSSRLARRLLTSRIVQEMGYASAAEKAQLIAYFRKAFEQAHPQVISKLHALQGASLRRTFDQMRTHQPRMLLLTGKHDRVVLPRDQRTVAEITQSPIIYLDCGHMTLLVEPEACAHAFMRFTKRQ